MDALFLLNCLFMTKKRVSRAKNKTKSGRTFLRFIKKTLLYFIVISVAWVLFYRFVNPPITWLIISETWLTNQPKDLPKRKWISYEDLSNNLKQAAIAGEDALFMDHHGFDTKAIQQAYQKNKAGKSIRGGSTISQQTAKNVFLWPQRSWLRKGFETWFTILIEILWGKERILEVYLNIIETGEGLFGMEAASQFYFNKSAQSLTKRQAALLIAVLPNPIRWKPNAPTPFINRKASTIMRYMSSSRIP
jgi:monofunctional biosynthetic peptidoglycan transglycosylase